MILIKCEFGEKTRLETAKVKKVSPHVNYTKWWVNELNYKYLFNSELKLILFFAKSSAINTEFNFWSD